MAVTGRYFLLTGMKEQARSCYNLLEKLAPDHPDTQRLKKALFFDTIGKNIKKLLDKWE